MRDRRRRLPPDPCGELPRAGEALHHQARAALRHVGDDGRPAMNLGDDAEIDGEGEMDRRAFLQSKIFSFNEDAIGAQVASATEFTCASRYRDIDRRAGPMTSVEASLHGQFPVSALLLSGRKCAIRVVDILLEKTSINCGPLCRDVLLMRSMMLGSYVVTGVEQTMYSREVSE